MAVQPAPSVPVTPSPRPVHADRPGGPVLLILATAAFVSLAGTRLCDAMLPALAVAFDSTTVEASAVVSAYAVGYGLTQLVWGPIGDRYGKLRVVAIAALACTVITLAAAAAPGLGSLIVIRFMMGAAAAAIFPLGLAWISDNVPLAARQQALARFSGVSVFGMVVGPLMGGLLSEMWSWRGAFVVVAVLYAVIALVVWRRARAADARAADTTAESADLLTGLRRLWVQPWARVVLIATGVEVALGIGCLALAPTVLHQRFDLPLDKAGAVVALFGIGGFLFSRAAPWLLQRLPRPYLPGVGGAVVGASIASLAWIPAWGWAAPACVGAGFGFFLLHNTLQVQVTQLSPEASGLAFSVFTACNFLGQSTGVAVIAVACAEVGDAWVFGTSGLGLGILGLMMARWIKRREAASGLA